MVERGIRLRSVTEEDAESVASLLAELGHSADAADVPSRLKAVTRDGGAALLAVDEAEQPLGLMCLAHHAVLHAPGPVAYITALVTSSAARRRGVGQLLVAAAIEWAKQRRCVRLSVTSAERRSDAHAFYVACGLPYTGRRFTIAFPPDE